MELEPFATVNRYFIFYLLFDMMFRFFLQKTPVMNIPKIGLPLILYSIGHYAFNPMTGYVIVAVSGVLGFALKDKVFTAIEKVY